MRRSVTVTTIAHRLQAAALQLGCLLFRGLGIDRASAFSGWCWQMGGPLTPRQRRVDYQLRMVFPAISDAEVRRISRAMWNNLGRVFAESLMLSEIVADRSRIDISNVQAIAADIAAHRVVSIATLHMGNWEVAGASAYLAGLPIAGVYKRLSNPVIEDWLHDQRERYFPGGLFNALDRGRAVRGLLGAMKTGSSVAMVADLFDRDGRLVDILGHPARCVDFPAVAARTFKVPLFAARVVRTDGVHFRIEVERIPVPVTEDRQADITAGTVGLHAAFARWIAATPEQWFWIHPKWEESRAVLKGHRPKV